jgi:hypothetical protein
MPGRSAQLVPINRIERRIVVKNIMTRLATLVALMALAIGAAVAASDCCNGGTCCSGDCCHHQHK